MPDQQEEMHQIDKIMDAPAEPKIEVVPSEPKERITNLSLEVSKLGETIMMRFKNRGGGFTIDGKSPPSELTEQEKGELEGRLIKVKNTLKEISDQLAVESQV